ncbi:lipase [Nocardioidaceae bacterium]|nr:lipase [Nocardioidaceae bacterium]
MVSSARVPGVLVAVLALAASLLTVLWSASPATASPATTSPATATTATTQAARTARGPAYSVPVSTLREAFSCRGRLRGADRQPVLLVHGTAFTADVNFDWNYERALPRRLGRVTCTVDLPGSGMLDVADNAEYVTYAIRRMNRRSDRLVDVVGYSQGGMLPRWSLTYWPDTRDRVDDVVGIDPSNHGTLDSQLICQPLVGCPAAFWQQASFSDFITTLNAGRETFPGIDYTVVYTITDEVVTPNLPPVASSELRGPADRVTNIAVQQLCPVHVAEHLSMGTTDPVGYAVVADALRFRGPADPDRVVSRDPRLCLRDVMPGVRRVQLPVNVLRVTEQIASAVALAPRVRREPRLPAYAR